MNSPFEMLQLQSRYERLIEKHARMREENEALMNLLFNADEPTQRLSKLQKKYRELQAKYEDLLDECQAAEESANHNWQEIQRYEAFLKNAFHLFRDN